MSQYRVLVTDPLSEAGLNILSQNPAVEVVDVSDSKLSVEELRQALSDMPGGLLRRLVNSGIHDQIRLMRSMPRNIYADDVRHCSSIGLRIEAF